MFAGGKWNKSTKSHVFSSDPRGKLGLMVETGVAVNEKNLFQAFFTPEQLARDVVNKVGVDGKRVLEPSAGEGAFVKACIAAGAKSVDCIELNPEFAKKLEGLKCSVSVGDFLEKSVGEKYERIVMNPPFTKNQDILHVEHALKFLAPGGVLVAIMGGNTSRPKFQKLISDWDATVQEIEAGTFKESGTNVSTVLVTIVNG